MGQASPDMPHPQVGETDQPLGNPSQVHQVAGEDEKGDGHVCGVLHGPDLQPFQVIRGLDRPHPVGEVAETVFPDPQRPDPGSLSHLFE